MRVSWTDEGGRQATGKRMRPDRNQKKTVTVRASEQEGLTPKNANWQQEARAVFKKKRRRGTKKREKRSRLSAIRGRRNAFRAENRPPAQTAKVH